MKDLIKYLVDYGYSESEAEWLVNQYPLCKCKEETLLSKCKEVNKFLDELGYTQEEVIKITKSLPALYSYSIDTIKRKIKDIIELGYTEEEVIKMTKLLPALYSYSIDNMKQKINDIMNLGYTQEEVIKMTKLLPSLYSLSMDNIKQKIKDIMELGYTQEEVIKMTKLLPPLYSLSIDNIKEKIEYLKEIELGFIVLEDTKKLMQSVSLTYARYEYLKAKGDSITEDNYRKLFYDNKQFTKQFSIDKKELLEKYPYQGRNKLEKKYIKCFK